MPLDPEVQAYLDHVAALGMPPLQTLTPQENRQQRKRLAELRRTLAGPGATEPVAHVEDRRIPVDGGDVAVRLYRPAGDGPFPVLVYFFGGGFIMGEIDAVDDACRMMANRAGCIVASAEYRLAPEHPFPGPVEDGFAAVRWAAEHAASFGGDPTRLAVGGESAGANIAAVACHLARAAGGPPIVFQLLVYPPIDFSAQRQTAPETAGRGTLSAERGNYFNRHYFPSEADMLSPLASPALVDDLRGLPDALVVTAEFDPLTAEGLAYADRLRQAGVQATSITLPGMIHGFYSLVGILTQATVAIEQASAALRAAFDRAGRTDDQTER